MKYTQLMLYIRIVRQVTGLLMTNLCKNMVKKLIWKFIEIFSTQILNFLSTCPAKNQAGCIERVIHHSHENQKFYLFKIAINEKCQKPKLTVKVIMVAMATAV